MIWLTWRQFRMQASVVMALLAIATIYLLITGSQMHDTLDGQAAACQNPGNPQCRGFYDIWTSYSRQQQILETVLIVAPALLGIFWGAPLIAGEYERGTHRMVWNQSITPTRWLTVKLGFTSLAVVASIGLLSLLTGWWSGPLDQLADKYGMFFVRFGPFEDVSASRFSWNMFGTHGIVPLGYAAFAFALGTVFGLLTRRTVAAMALALVVFVGVQAVFVSQIRPNLLPPATASVPVDAALLSNGESFQTGSGHVQFGWPGPAGGWLLSESDFLNSSGQPVAAGEVSKCLARYDDGSCFVPYDLHISYTYQPADDYWPLQWAETGVYLALAGLLGGVCYRRIRRQPD